MGAVGGVAILGGNFEAATFPEDKVVQRSLTAGTQESSAIDAVILDALPLGAPGQLDSHAFLWKGHSHNGSPHTIDWKAFVNVTADDGTGSLWTLQTRIDGAPYTDILTVDDNGLLTVSGATFTMDQLIIDSDNTEAVLIRKDGDAGDVFIVDTVNDVVRMGSNDTFLTFGAASDTRLERVGPRILRMREPGVGGVGLGAGGENTLQLYARDDVSAARFLELTGDGPRALVKANRSAGGGQFDLNFDVNVGRLAFFNEGVQRWNIQGSVTGDFEFTPFITDRYDLGSATFAVRDLYTNGVLIGQDQITGGFNAITIDHADLTGDANQDSGAILLTGKGFETATPHDIDWKFFVNVTADDGTGSIFTIQTQIDTAGFATVFQLDDAGNLTIPGSFTVDGLIIDVDSAEAFLVRKNGDGGDVFIVDTVAPTTRFGTGETTPTEIIVLDTPALVGDGQRDSHAILWTGKGFETATPHDIDWKAFVDVTADDGTGSIWTLQARIDAASFVDEFTITATTSPTLVTIGPGSTGAALAFGPLGSDGPATTGTIRLKNLDTIVIRNAQDSVDHFILESLVSDEYNMFDPLIGRVDFLDLHTRFFKRITVHQDGTAINALQVGGTGIFIVDTTNRLIRLAQNDAVLTWGTASDAQIHRGDGADILEQRRGANSQKWNIYDNFVSNSDYDRLGIYIGGGPPVISAIIRPESTDATQGINLLVESLANAFGDGSLTLKGGTGGATIVLNTAASAGSGSFSTGTFTFGGDLRVTGLIATVGVGEGTPGIGVKFDIAGQGAAAFADSHSIDLIGAGELANRATWRTFVDVIDVTANSIWTLQDDKNGGGFITNFSITDDGGFNFPLPLPSHAIGLAIDTQNQLTLGGDYFALAGADLIGTRFKIQDRITNATGNITGFFAMNIDANMRTQGVTESVANIATLSINEPQITDLLTGGGLITNAQSLLITGAPTEGVNNYALRILAGDLIVDDAAAILFRVGGSDLSALSVAPTGRLELGLSAAPWGRINLYSQIINNIGGDLRIVATAANHSAETQMQVTFVDVATSAGSSVTAASLIPAGSFVIGVTVRVLTTVTGPTGFDVGDGIDVDRWGNSIPVTAGQTTNITSFTSGAVTTFQVANDVVITSDGVDFTGGSIRITVHYTQLRTSDA